MVVDSRNAPQISDTVHWATKHPPDHVRASLRPDLRRTRLIHKSNQMQHRLVTRRGALLSSTALVASPLMPRPAAAGLGSKGAAAPPVLPIADLPMRRIRLPSGGVGRDYVLIELKVQGQRYEFMLDSGLTAEIITPQLRRELGIQGSGRKISGLGAGGAAAAGDLVPLEGAALCCGEFPGRSVEELPLPRLNAVVLDFPQQHLDPAHDVAGMLGMEMLELFDADLDFGKSRVRLWPPGSISALAASQKLVEVPAAVLNETGVLGIRATSTTAANSQPFVGIVDCGASFSAVNLAAARLLGLVGQRGELLAKPGPDILGVGVDGKPQPLPTTSVGFTFAGNASKDPRSGQLLFEPPPREFRPWAPVMAAVGDLPVFSQLLGDGNGTTPFKGPAALIGLDVWSQRRTVIASVPPGAGRSRQRSIFVSAK